MYLKYFASSLNSPRKTLEAVVIALFLCEMTFKVRNFVFIVEPSHCEASGSALIV